MSCSTNGTLCSTGIVSGTVHSVLSQIKHDLYGLGLSRPQGSVKALHHFFLSEAQSVSDQRKNIYLLVGQQAKAQWVLQVTHTTCNYRESLSVNAAYSGPESVQTKFIKEITTHGWFTYTSAVAARYAHLACQQCPSSTIGVLPRIW